jgi:hypothetical protein
VKKDKVFGEQTPASYHIVGNNMFGSQRSESVKSGDYIVEVGHMVEVCNKEKLYEKYDVREE